MYIIKCKNIFVFVPTHMHRKKTARKSLDFGGIIGNVLFFFPFYFLYFTGVVQKAYIPLSEKVISEKKISSTERSLNFN